ncbi:mitochondrial coenzyme A transporter SLC25A42-like [Uloborus diversus]|uniref:mitochondrial coenzyme A transporter SLC25A42-like n=1 Tax=Uloborus diversus TaxID=327109 RepID=UPI002409A6DD|nr:mitochondrial coenzyme A transporter SLC25A42-like [Uloborus diversus]
MYSTGLKFVLCEGMAQENVLKNRHESLTFSFITTAYMQASKSSSSEEKSDKVSAAKLSTWKKVFSSLAAGAAAGALAKTTIAPLDRTKINFQITNTRYTMKEAFRFIRHSYRQSGFRSLWRGNSATMARIIPYASIQFAAHEQWKHLLGVETNEERKKHPGRSFIAGSLAGVVSTTCTYPLDLARARMAVTHKEMYNSLSQVFFKIYKFEGFTTFYRGYAPTLLGVIPYSGTGFFTYETLKRLHSEKTNDRPLHASERLIFGATAGLLGQSASYPLDIVRRRMQTATVTGYLYSTIRSTLAKVYKDEGFLGLYKGLSLNWIKGPIAVGISFTTFDITQNFLRSISFFSTT